MPDIDPLTPEGVRDLIADLTAYAGSGTGDVYGPAELFRHAAAALTASLPREDADLPDTVAAIEAVQRLAQSVMDEHEGEEDVQATIFEDMEIAEAPIRWAQTHVCPRTVETAEVTGASLIAAERVRVVTEEGYDAEHDRGQGQRLVRAAEAYIRHVGGGRSFTPFGYERSPSFWPWAERFWKPTGDPVRDLTKAGQLIAAAIDSLLLPPVPPTPETEESDRG